MYKPFEFMKDGNALWLVRHSRTKSFYQFSHYDSVKGCLYQKPAQFNEESEAGILCNLLNIRGSYQMDRLELLEEKVEILESRLNAYGIPTDIWLSPEDASKILGFGRDKIIAELIRAEKARSNGEKPDLIYGNHYHNGAAVGASRPLWKVNAEKLREVLINTPPEERPIYSWEQSR